MLFTFPFHHRKVTQHIRSPAARDSLNLGNHLMKYDENPGDTEHFDAHKVSGTVEMNLFRTE